VNLAAVEQIFRVKGRPDHRFGTLRAFIISVSLKNATHIVMAR